MLIERESLKRTVPWAVYDFVLLCPYVCEYECENVRVDILQGKCTSWPQVTPPLCTRMCVQWHSLAPQQTNPRPVIWHFQKALQIVYSSVKSAAGDECLGRLPSAAWRGILMCRSVTSGRPKAFSRMLAKSISYQNDCKCFIQRTCD